MDDKQRILFTIGLLVILGWTLRHGLSADRVAERRKSSLSPTVCGRQVLDEDLEKQRSRDLDELLSETVRQSGIRLDFGPTPEQRYRFFKDFHYVPLKSDDERVQAVLHLRQALRAYAPDLLPQVLSRVVVVKRLWLWADYPLAGFASSREEEIFVTLEGLKSWDSFHHEVGHLLDSGWFADLWRGDWTAENPKGWHYSHPNGWDEGKFEGVRIGDPFSQGFVSSYGSTDVKEDFAEYFALQMHCPDSLAVLADRHERIAAKREVLLSFVDWLGVSAGSSQD